MVKFILDNFDTIFRDEKSFETFDKMILDLAVRGKLVPQIEDEEPASKLLQRIREEKERLIVEKVIKKEKPLSPITEDEKPFEIPSSWEFVKVNEIAFVTKLAGFEYTKNIFPNLSQKGIPLFKGKNVQSGKLILEFESFIPQEISDELFRSQLRKKCLLTPYVGTIGNIAIFDGSFKAHLGSNVGKIELFNNFTKNMLEEYVLLFFKSTYGLLQLKKHRKATAQESISIEAIRDSIVIVPPLEEQERIVEKVEKLQELSKKFKEIYNSNEKTRANLKKSILEEVEKSGTNNELLISLEKLFGNFEKVIKTKEDVKDIRNLVLSLAVRGKLVPQIEDEEPASKLLEKIKEEKERLIAEKVIKKEKPLPPITEDEKPYDIPNSWEWVYFSDVLDVRDGTHDTPKYEASGIPLVTSKNIYNGTLNFENLKYISYEDHLKISSRSKVELNDILFAMIGSIGNPVIVDTNKEFSIKNVALFKYYIKNSIDKKYLWYYLKHVQDNMILNASGGVQKFVSLGYLRKYIFSLPPLEEQERIVKRVDELMVVCDTLESKIEIGEKINQKLLASLLK